MDEELEELNAEYLERHPDADSLFDHWFAYGGKELKNILKGAKGKKIIFESDPNVTDDAKFHYI